MSQEVDGIARPEARRQKCDTLNEWAKTRCSETYHLPIEAAIREAARRTFKWVLDDGFGYDMSQKKFVMVVAEDLRETLERYVEVMNPKTADSACVGRRVHGIFLKYLASKPSKFRKKTTTLWNEVWTKTLETMEERGEAFNVVGFDPDDPENDACDPDELRGLGDENDACGCVVS